MKKLLIVLFITTIVSLAVACSEGGYDTADYTPEPSTTVSADLQEQNTTDPVYSEIDETGWTVIRILDPQGFVSIGDISLAADFKSIPILSKELYRLSNKSDEIERLDWDGQIRSYNDGFICIDDDVTKPVYCSMIKLCSDLNAMRQTLESLGVADEPKEVAAVTAFGYPIVLFVECEDSICYVTIDDEEDYYGRDIDDLDKYVLRVYSPREFMEKYRLISCSVYVNGVCDPQCIAYKLGSTEEIYLMTILSSFDPSAKLFINDDNVVLTFLSKEYLVDLYNCRIISDEGEAKETHIPPGSTWLCFVRDDDIVLDMYALERMLNGLNISVSKSFENGLYRIDVNSNF